MIEPLQDTNPTPEQLKKLRLKHKLSVKEVGDLLGLSATTIEKIESGNIDMSISNWNKLNNKLHNLKSNTSNKQKVIRKDKPRKIIDKLNLNSPYDIKELVKKSSSWFNSEVKMLASSVHLKSSKATSLEIGTMYMYYYDAKHKDTLPYWDRFPIVFPFSILPDGFIGINFHYLPYKERIILLNALETVAYSNRTDVSTKLKLSYQVLQTIAKNKKFEKCIHRYLFTHFKTPLKKIHSDNWIVALLLPNEMFTGATAKQVWSMK